MPHLIPEKGAVDRSLADILPVLKRAKSQSLNLATARIDVTENGVFITVTDRYVLVVTKIDGEVENYTQPVTVCLPIEDVEVWKAAKTGVSDVKIEPDGVTVGRLHLQHIDLEYPSVFVLFKRVFNNDAQPAGDENTFDVTRVKHIKNVQAIGRFDGMWAFAAEDRVFGIQTPVKTQWESIAGDIEQLVKENA